MTRLKTCPSLVPPPPVPPLRTAVGAGPEPSRWPRASRFPSPILEFFNFLQEVRHQLRMVERPRFGEIGFTSGAVILLLVVLSFYMSSLTVLVGALFRAVGLHLP